MNIILSRNWTRYEVYKLQFITNFGILETYVEKGDDINHVNEFYVAIVVIATGACCRCGKGYRVDRCKLSNGNGGRRRIFQK